MFEDRRQAGRLLGRQLKATSLSSDLIIGLARGGVVVAAEISNVLGTPFDVLVVKKIGSPATRELAIGAVAPEGILYVDEDMMSITGADETYMKSRASVLTEEIRQTTALYRGRKNPVSVNRRTIVLTDDGAATGATMYAAIRWAKKNKAKKIIVALPVAPPEIAAKLQTFVHDVIVLEKTADFGAVGQFYRDFAQITDEEVIQLLT